MDSNRTELLDKIKAQGDVVRKLKEQKAEKSMVRFYANCVLGKFFWLFKEKIEIRVTQQA